MNRWYEVWSLKGNYPICECETLDEAAGIVRDLMGRNVGYQWGTLAISEVEQGEYNAETVRLITGEELRGMVAA